MGVTEWHRVVLAGCWVSLMLIYLLGDVLRLFAGTNVPGHIGDEPAQSWMWTLAAIIMLVPISMTLTSLLAPPGALKWITAMAAIALALFNLAGMPYKEFFDNMLLVISIALNAFIVWYAWQMN